MARSGRKLPDEEIKLMIKEGDHNDNNKVDFNEFLLLMDHKQANESFLSTNNSYDDL